jgi:hypothetical protein
VTIRPAELLLVGGDVRIAFLWCDRCLPPWVINHIPIERPPLRRSLLAGGQATGLRQLHFRPSAVLVACFSRNALNLLSRLDAIY